MANIEQVPDYINKEKTVIVLHKDIIPEEFLPTFNSTTIEMFIQDIPGLSEHFIYTNDDMYPVAPLAKEDFFTDDGKIKICFTRRDIRQNGKQFRKVCLNNYQHVTESLSIKHDEFTYLKPEHSMTPMTVCGCKACMNRLKDIVYRNIGAFRTEFQHNQYIYPIYEFCTGKVQLGGPKFIYTSLKRAPEDIVFLLENSGNQIVCINDVKVPDRSSIDTSKLIAAFEAITK